MNEPSSRTCSFVGGYFISQAFSKPWLYIRIHSSIFFLRTMVINQRTVPVTTGSVPACYDHKCLFFICILVSGFKAFEKFQNQRTTHSGYLKILKELVGFVKEP
jgi:hypothetical protein